MDYKEKYEQALEVAQRFYNNSVAITKKGLEDIFPELAESEDERIRGAIIDHLKDNNLTEWADWLEKQGEQPKKHDVCDNCDQQGCCVSPCPMKLIEKHGEQKPSEDEDREYACQSSEHYTRRELMIYNLGIADGKRMIEDAIKETEQKPAWSKEDDTALGDALWCCKQAASIAKDENDMGNIWYAENWLKSLKDRVQPQPKQEWSEEDKIMKGKTINYINAARMYVDVERVSSRWADECVDWLKSLRPQNHNKWHSIDEKPVYPCNILYKAPNGNIFLFKYMEDGKPAGPETSYLHSFDDGEWMYLKDVESQSHWKPSDEQMDALEKECIAHSNYELCRLLEQLKKLK